MSNPIKAGSPTVHRTADMVAAYPGQSSEWLAKRLGWSLSHTKKVLTMLSKDGLIAYTRLAGPLRWYTVADLAALMPTLLSQISVRARQKDRARNRRHAERKAGRAADVAGDPVLPDQPIRRHVSPDAPLPFVCRAPASVFSWGAML